MAGAGLRRGYRWKWRDSARAHGNGYPEPLMFHLTTEPTPTSKLPPAYSYRYVLYTYRCVWHSYTRGVRRRSAARAESLRWQRL